MENSTDTPPTRPRARARYAHLYMPLITVFLILANPPIVQQLIKPIDRPWNVSLWIAFFTLATYTVGSCVHKPDTVPSDGVRFTRKHEAIRALVLFTYGRWMGTPINLQFLVADHVLCYLVSGYLVGEPARQRRSEFLVALAWLVGSGAIFAAVPPAFPLLYFVVGMVDRLVWRTAYIALVDDIVSVLSRPDVRTVRGRATLMIVQGFTITSLVWGLLRMLTRWLHARAGKAA